MRIGAGWIVVAPWQAGEKVPLVIPGALQT